MPDRGICNDVTPWYPGGHAHVGVPAAPPEADSEGAREHRLELLVRVHDVAPSGSEVLRGAASKSVGPTPHPPHAGESQTDRGPAARLAGGASWRRNPRGDCSKSPTGQPREGGPSPSGEAGRGGWHPVLNSYIVRLTPVIVVAMMMMMPAPAGTDRYRYDAGLSSNRHRQEQQRDPEIAHGRTSLNP